MARSRGRSITADYSKVHPLSFWYTFVDLARSHIRQLSTVFVNLARFHLKSVRAADGEKERPERHRRGAAPRSAHCCHLRGRGGSYRQC